MRGIDMIAMAAKTQPGQVGCGFCGYIGKRSEFVWGRGRIFGEHPEHRYCPKCRQSITWYGATGRP